MSTARSGGCQCGAVSDSAAAQPQGYACHCLDCQKQSSSAFGISIPMDAADLSVEGPLECFIKTADSGAQTDCFFCSHCGSRIYHEGKSRPGKVTSPVFRPCQFQSGGPCGPRLSCRGLIQLVAPCRAAFCPVIIEIRVGEQTLIA